VIKIVLFTVKMQVTYKHRSGDLRYIEVMILKWNVWLKQFNTEALTGKDGVGKILNPD